MDIKDKVFDIKEILQYCESKKYNPWFTPTNSRKVSEAKDRLLFGDEWTFWRSSFHPDADLNNVDQMFYVNLQDAVNIKYLWKDDWTTLCNEFDVPWKDEMLCTKILDDYSDVVKSGDEKALEKYFKWQSDIYKGLKIIAKKMNLSMPDAVKVYGDAFLKLYKKLVQEAKNKQVSSIQSLLDATSEQITLRGKQTRESLTNSGVLPPPKPVMYPSDTPLYTKGKPMTHNEADSSNCNPNYSKPDYKVKVASGVFHKMSYTSNCATCVLVYELRRRGYNVKAKPHDDTVSQGYLSSADNMTPFMSSHSVGAYYTPDGKNATAMMSATATTPKKVIEWMKETIQDGQRYIIRVVWKKGNYGHVMIAERENGEMFIFDPQTGEHYKTELEIEALLKTVKLKPSNKKSSLWLLRCDNVLIDETMLNSLLE